jgi:hypothetical protein
MQLVISNEQLKDLLRLQFDAKADHPYLHIEEDIHEAGKRKSVYTTGGSANDLTTFFLDDLKCMVCQ